MASKEAVERIKADEGFIKRAKHIKVLGKPEKNKTIGWGYNLSNPTAMEDLVLAGVSSKDIPKIFSGEMELGKKVGENLFQISLQRAEADVLSLYPDIRKAPKEFRDVIVNMSFQMGKSSLSEFEEMKASYENRDWAGVKREILDSDFADQTPSRAKRHVKALGALKTEGKKKPAQAIAKTPEVLKKEQVKSERVSQIAALLRKKKKVDQIADLLRKHRQQLDPTVAVTPKEEEEPTVKVEASVEDKKEPTTEVDLSTEVKKEEDLITNKEQE